MSAEVVGIEAYGGGQLTLLRQPPEDADVAGEHGEVFTRRWVVELILDLVGYAPSHDLALQLAVEPACGTGAFLGPIVSRLSESCRTYGRPISDAADALRAFDLLPRNVAASRRLVTAVLEADGWHSAEATKMAASWIQTADYLLHPGQDATADVVVGNPPYIRLEEVPDARMAAYRRTCRTMTGRADIYIGFFETALRSLKSGGRVGFICADRWMRNQYGRHLRGLITSGFSLDVAVAMHDVDAFQSPVAAYPAVTVISRRPQGTAVVAEATAAFGEDDTVELTGFVHDSSTAHPAAETTLTAARFEVSRLPHWFSGDDSWPTGSPARLAMIEHLTDNFPPLEDPATGTRVGIGVATGADDIFITCDDDVAEAERMLPLAMVSDVASGRLQWSGNYLVNPWDETGLVHLRDYPRMFGYLDLHAAALRKRHVAGRQPDRWYRTIDRVNPKLTATPKLLIPDMRMAMHPVLDEGQTYPHHNLYVITSTAWDLRVLGGLLLSRVATAFVEAFCVRMRGGTLRFQAQYLRRIRVPRLNEISDADTAALATAFTARDVDAATTIALRLYGLDKRTL
jgi:hypothetical protein